jgi:hypothetical protein
VARCRLIVRSRRAGGPPRRRRVRARGVEWIVAATGTQPRPSPRAIQRRGPRHRGARSPAVAEPGHPAGCARVESGPGEGVAAGDEACPSRRNAAVRMLVLATQPRPPAMVWIRTKWPRWQSTSSIGSPSRPLHHSGGPQRPHRSPGRPHGTRLLPHRRRPRRQRVGPLCPRPGLPGLLLKARLIGTPSGGGFPTRDLASDNVRFAGSRKPEAPAPAAPSPVTTSDDGSERRPAPGFRSPIR